MKRLFTALLFSLFCLAVTASAQTSKGFITGSVIDPNGALVPNANVTITNINTAAVRQTQSLADGNYRFDAVDSGVYNLEVSAAGFDTVKNENVVVTAAQTTEINLQLSIAGASATVNVTAASNVELQSTDGGRINTLEKRQITDLPVPALNPVNLVLTLPGTIDVSQTKGAGRVQGVEFSANGLRPRSNNQLIDGLDNNDNAVNGQAYVPTLRDGYNEVAVLQSNYSAEFGRAGGAVVNLITRSGTNEFHGSAFDIIENSAFNSLTPGQRRRGLTEAPQFTRNTLGGSLGGPVIKNKLFFFGTYQSHIAPNTAEAIAIIPTAAGFTAFRSAFPAGTNANADYYLGVMGDARGTTNPFTVFLGGNRPAVEFATISRLVKQPLKTHDAIGRLDFNPTDRDNLTFRYLFNKMKYENQFPTVFDGFEVDSPTLIHNVYASYTRVFAPNLTNEMRFGYGFMDLQFAPRNEAVGVEGPEIAFSGSGLGRGISGIGLNRLIPQGRKFNNFQFQDTATYTVGNHTLRAGADLNFQRNKLVIPLNTRGSLVFSGTARDDTTDTPAAATLENFVRGFTGGGGSVSRVFGIREFNPNVFYQNYFINDEWRILDNLTVNLGLRYENYGTPFNEAAFPAFAGFDVPIDTIVRQKADNNNFAPRFSFAYSPVFNDGVGYTLFGNRETVIRGGFAVNYDVFFSNMLVNTASASPNVRSYTALGQVAANPTVVGTTFVNQLPTTAPFSATTAITSIDPNLKNPESYVYNFGIQRRFAKNYILDVAYVGSRGLKLFIGEQINPTIMVGSGTRRLNPSRGSVILRTNGGDSRYNSLQMRFERGYKNGFLFRSAYTYSKTIDNVNSDVYTHTGGSPLGSNPFDRTADRGRASFDIPHAASFSGIWDIPTFGARGTLGKIVNGFTLGAIYRVQSGAVENVFVNGIDLNRDGTSTNDRPAISNPNAPANSVAILGTLFGGGNGYVTANGTLIDLNNARYVVDRNLRTNIVGRNTLRAPLFKTLDVSFSRSFGLGFTGMDDLRFQIRADFFNVLNIPNYAPGTGDVLSTGFNDPYTFGEGSARSGRIQLRLAF